MKNERKGKQFFFINQYCIFMNQYCDKNVWHCICICISICLGVVWTDFVEWLMDLLWVQWTEHVAIGLHYAKPVSSSIIFYRRIRSLATDYPCRVCRHGLYTCVFCILVDIFGNLILSKFDRAIDVIFPVYIRIFPCILIYRTIWIPYFHLLYFHASNCDCFTKYPCTLFSHPCSLDSFYMSL